MQSFFALDSSFSRPIEYSAHLLGKQLYGRRLHHINLNRFEIISLKSVYCKDQQRNNNN
jgi:hypothetical protein